MNPGEWSDPSRRMNFMNFPMTPNSNAQITNFVQNQSPQNQAATAAAPANPAVAPIQVPGNNPLQIPVIPPGNNATPATPAALTPNRNANNHVPQANQMTPAAPQIAPAAIPVVQAAAATVIPAAQITPVPPGLTQAAIAAAAAQANVQRPLPAVPPAQPVHYQQFQHQQYQNPLQQMFPQILNPSTKEMPTLAIGSNLLDTMGHGAEIDTSSMGSFGKHPRHSRRIFEYLLWDNWWKVDGAARAIILAKLAAESAAILPHIDDIFRHLLSSHQLYEMLKNAHSSNTWANVIQIKDQLFNTVSGTTPDQILQSVQKWHTGVASIRNANNPNCPVVYMDFAK
ncbi:hypothetical protein C8J56DRAFT_894309 [Mycena floridula]|nr:hypothetical protein C8J56DRAFT_894309 [Mycena floridula]